MGRRTAAGLGAAVIVAVALVAFIATRDRAATSFARIESPRKEAAASSEAPSPRPAALAPDAARSPEAVPEEITASITGTVVDPEGRPVPGARVIAIADDAGAAPPLDGAAACDEAGRFEIGALAPASRYAVVADAPGFAPGCTRPVVPGSDVVVALEAGGSLRGVVRDLSGRPILGARVEWRAVVHGARWERATVSSADGAYSIDAVPRWRSFMDASLLAAQLVASAPGFASVKLEHVLIDGGETSATRDIFLSRPGRVKGVVLDAETEAPIAGARVRLVSSEDETEFTERWGLPRPNPFAGEPLAECAADASGRFEWSEVPSWGVHTPGTNRFGLASLDPRIGEAVATAAGYCAGTADVAVPEGGAGIDVEVRCWPAAVVTGRVVDDAGRPVAGIHVAASNAACRARPISPDDGDGAGSIGQTDGAGLYRLAGVPALRESGSSIVIRAALGGVEVSVDARAGESVVAPDIVVAARPRVLVRVTDLEGRPVRNAVVSEAVFQSPRGRTGEDGVFELLAFVREETSALPIRAWVNAEGYGAEQSDAVTPSAKEPPSVTVRLGPEHRLAGRVVFESGEPVERARVLVALAGAAPADAFMEANWPELSSEWLRADASTRSDGTFEVRSLPPGPYHVQVRRYRRNARPESESVVAENVSTDDRDLRLVLADPGEEESRVPLEGTVCDRSTGEPLVRIRVALRRPSPYEKRFAVAVAPGRFRFEAIDPGTYDLEVGARGYATVVWSGIVVTAAGADRPLEVRLDRGVTVSGTVRTTTGEPLRNGLLYFVGSRSVQPDVAPLGRDGTYEVTGLERGARYALSVIDETEDDARRTWCAVGSGAELLVPLDADEVTRDVDVSPAGSCGVSLYGSALYPRGDDDDDTGAPAELIALRERARIECVASDGRVAWEKSGIVSPLHWLSLSDGAYTIRLHVPGHDPVDRLVTLRRAEHVNVSFSAE